MTDRELLELAAKAAGLMLAERRGSFAIVETVDDSFWTSDDIWNPLEDDGDALRLAVKLGLHVGKAAISPTRYAGRDDFEIPGNSFYEFENGDPYAATRRAIVRAAAALGEQHDQ